MDPITVTHLVQDRTDDLQRTADQLRQERALRSTSAAEAVVPVTANAIAPADARGRVAVQPIRPADARRAPAPAGGCAPAEPAA